MEGNCEGKKEIIRKEGRKEGKEGRKEGRKEGKEGRKERRKKGGR